MVLAAPPCSSLHRVCRICDGHIPGGDRLHREPVEQAGGGVLVPHLFHGGRVDHRSRVYEGAVSEDLGQVYWPRGTR